MKYLLRVIVFVSSILTLYILAAFLTWELNPANWYINQDRDYRWVGADIIHYTTTNYMVTRCVIIVLFFMCIIVPSEEVWFSKQFRKKYGIN